MKILKSNIFILICLWCCSFLPSASANPIKTKTTLQSSSGDEVDITYIILVNDGEVTIEFQEVTKRLSLETREKYEVNYVKVLFFERNGNYTDARFKFEDGIETKVLDVNSDDIDYTRSEEGYHKIEAKGFITLKLLAEEALLNLPVYLAHYDKRGKYTVFAKCDDFKIDLKKNRPSTRGRVITTPTTRIVEDTVYDVVETGGETLSAEDEAEIQINRLREQLRPNMSIEELQRLSSRVENLDNMVIKDERISQLREEVIQEYYNRLEKARNSCPVVDPKESEARADLEYLKERMEKFDSLSEQDLEELDNDVRQLKKNANSIKDENLKNEIKEAAEKCESKIKEKNKQKERRNIFSIIGAILLGILIIAGSMVFQHFRNIRNIKNMEEAQNQIARRAQDEARRRAQNAVRSRVNRVQGQVRQKTRSTIQSGVKSGTTKITKGIGLNKKNLSI